MSEVPPFDLSRVAREVDLPLGSVAATVELLDAGNTIPFITRYRRDQTGGLDEEQIARVRDAVERQRQLEDRKRTILRSIESQNKLTDELRKAIQSAESVKRLEDLYLPYRPKKESLASKARDQGLGVLAEEILNEVPQANELETRAADFINTDKINQETEGEKHVPDAASALQGAGHIIAESFNERSELRQRVRKLYQKTSKLVCNKTKDDNKKNAQYKDYLEYEEKLGRTPPHRILAINRGEKGKVLRVRIEPQEEELLTLATEIAIKPDHQHHGFLQGCLRDALTRLLLPSLEREERRDMTEKAELHAIKVFARNLRNLLLQPPLPGRRVLAVDPGFKAGCKLAALDEHGGLLDHAIVHIVGKDEIKSAAREKLIGLVQQYDLQVIAVGNGTACRQVEELLADILGNELTDKDVHYAVVNEAGASVYSTSEIGREELPEADPMQRSAVSIGRRLQDPLSELVKIDPASIGVGLYQHDAKAKHLRQSLDDVVESCVNHVGVDLNSASAALLRYVSGMNQLTARRVFEHRQEQGVFKSRKQLLDVKGLGEATFVQAAGFLKIVDGENPLDCTWIHPEDYDTVARLLGKFEMTIDQLNSGTNVEQLQERIKECDRDQLAAELEIGRYALDQILSAVTRPGRDPREDLPPPLFRRDIVKFEQLEVGMELFGTVLNVVDFGAFVDVGLSDSGLVHISQLSNDYVKSPHERVSVGDSVRVWVSSLDNERRRVALTMIEPGTERPPEQRRSRANRQQKEGQKRDSTRGRGKGNSTEASPAGRGGENRSRKSKQANQRGRGRQQRGQAPPRGQGSYEKRAKKETVPLTKEMEEGKEAMRSFGDLLQFHRKKSNRDSPQDGKD